MLVSESVPFLTLLILPYRKGVVSDQSAVLHAWLLMSVEEGDEGVK